MLDLDDGEALVAGLTWTPGLTEMRTLLWRITSDGAAHPVVAQGLAGYGAVNGCSGGDTVALEVAGPDARRGLAVSTDRGASFEVHTDAPVAGAPASVATSALNCDVDPDGRITVLVAGGPQSELHVLDPASGDWEQVDHPAGDLVTLTNIQYLPEIGWVLTGFESRGGDETGLAYLSENLTSWATLDVATKGDLTSVHDAATGGTHLHLAGAEDGEPALWTLPTNHLPTTHDP